MTNTEINILNNVISYQTHLNIDQKVNYVYSKYDIGLSKMNQIREYFKMNQ